MEMSAYKKMFLVLFALFFSAACAAQNPELAALVDGYFGGIQAEDAGKVLSVMVPSGQEAASRDALGTFFEMMDQKDIEWSFESESFNGDKANMVFDVSGKIVDQETGNEAEVSDKYIALFQDRKSVV